MKGISYLFPQTVFRANTPYNRNLRVIDYFGKRRLLVNGSQQSGPYILSMLKKALTSFKIINRSSLHHFLMLGMGAANTLEIVKKYFPLLKTTIVEIDPVIISVAKKYFNFDAYTDTKVICSDALEYVGKASVSGNVFDLIEIDVYSGRDVPDFILQESFIRKVKSMLAHDGDLFINYDWDLGYEDKWKLLFERLRKYYSFVEVKKIDHNMFFHAKQ